ncbi:MAG: CCA tRNA nucleotidyltransferase [Candidatus Nanosalina sp.]
MMNWENLREKVVEKKYPDEEEFDRLWKKYKEVSEYIEGEYGIETFFAGSAGRGTCVSGDRDIDIFLMFPEDLERQELENCGLDIGEETFRHFDGDYDVEYAEHPYTKGEIEGFEIEIVPCYDTDPEEIQSAVDRSPHHARWVKENLDREQKEDVVLLKSFLKAEGLYGSSLKNRGFSGYLCEILIYEYGSLEKLVEEAEQWREKTILDPEMHHKKDLPEKLEEKFSNDSLVVIDPVDPERNVAAVLTTENYAKFIHRCWKFDQKPGVNYFEREETEVDKFTLQKEVEQRGDFIVLEFDAIDEPEDIVYPQMRKAMKRLQNILENHDFRIYESGFHVGGKIRVFFELGSSLPGVRYQRGPKVFHGPEHLEEFTSKYENTFIRDERIYAKVEREYTEAKELLKDFLDEEPGELEKKGVPGNVADGMQGFRMTDPLVEDEEWLKFLTRKLEVEP